MVTAEQPPADLLPPASALTVLLPADIDLATGRGLRHPQAHEVWCGMVWGRLGRGDRAAAAFALVTAGQLAPWIAAERGRLRRELGDHADAARLEEPALSVAEDPVDRAMLLISLAADAVGHADAAVAGQRLATALRVLNEEAPPGPRRERQRLRAGWVEVEIALLRRQVPDDSALPSLDADGELRLPPPYAAGSRFHLAKGLLFAGVVRADRVLLDMALEHAPPALWWAVQLARAAHGVAGAEVAGQRARAAIVPLPG